MAIFPLIRIHRIHTIIEHLKRCCGRNNNYTYCIFKRTFKCYIHTRALTSEKRLIKTEMGTNILNLTKFWVIGVYTIKISYKNIESIFQMGEWIYEKWTHNLFEYCFVEVIPMFSHFDFPGYLASWWNVGGYGLYSLWAKFFFTLNNLLLAFGSWTGVCVGFYYLSKGTCPKIVVAVSVSPSRILSWDRIA